jgi:CubicO group peptidase (beta-lactamase class C family)
MRIYPLGTARLLVALLILQIGNAAASADSPGLAAFIERGMELWNVPGMAVTVVTSDSVSFRQGFGRTAIGDGVAVDEHTLFANASTTKAMVAAGVLIRC